MDKKDVIFRELTEKEVQERKPFSHFGWEGNGALSFVSISDGYWDAAKILLGRMFSESQRIDVIDTLIYPLFFNYRHSIETYLKALFFDHGNKTDVERQKFIKLGHNLQSLWSYLRPTLDAGKKHVGSPVNLDAIEHYIKEINKFDPDSMVMRYPINKDLKVNKGHQYRLDFIHFGERMNELCDSLRQLNHDISNQMDESATPEELNEYLEVFTKYKDEIDGFLSLLEKDSKEECKESGKDFFDLESLLSNDEMSEVDEFFQDCSPDLLILLNNLYYAGQSVNQHVVRLSTSPVRRQKEFVRFCNKLLNKDGLSFGKEPSMDQINIEGKQSSSLIAGISTSISILNLLDRPQ